MNIESMSFQGMSYFYDAAEVMFIDINYTFPKSRVLKISSEQGGKSTLLKLMAGLLQVTDGQYLINGQDVSQMTFEEFLPYRLRFGYSFDFGGLLTNKTLAENLLLPLQYHNIQTSESEKWVQTLLQRFKLDRIQHLRPFNAPGSQRKATCVARAFVHKPDILLLDEPDAGLKDEGIMNLCQTIEECLEKHGMKQVIYVSDNVLLDKRLGPEEIVLNKTEFGSARKAA